MLIDFTKLPMAAYLCGNHFTADQFNKTSVRPRLKADALPDQVLKDTLQQPSIQATHKKALADLTNKNLDSPGLIHVQEAFDYSDGAPNSIRIALQYPSVSLKPNQALTNQDITSGSKSSKPGRFSVICQAPNCDKRRGDQSSSFLRFPRNSDRCLEWCSILGVLYNRSLSKRWICGAHFDDKQFTSARKQRLKKFATPIRLTNINSSFSITNTDNGAQKSSKAPQSSSSGNLSSRKIIPNSPRTPTPQKKLRKSRQQGLFRHLQISLEKPFHMFGDHKVFMIYDTCHLVKLVRNNLQVHGFMTNDGHASWEKLQLFYDIDSCTENRLAPKLTSKHFELTDMTKMKVKLATQLFSNSVASGITSIGIGIGFTRANGEAGLVYSCSREEDE